MPPGRACARRASRFSDESSRAIPPPPHKPASHVIRPVARLRIADVPAKSRICLIPCRRHPIMGPPIVLIGRNDIREAGEWTNRCVRRLVLSLGACFVLGIIVFTVVRPNAGEGYPRIQRGVLLI